MKMRFPIATTALFTFLCVPALTGASSKHNVTPIQKVLQLLSGMLEKAKTGKHNEEVEWAAYKMFCTNVELEKQTSIQEADQQKGTLKADAEQHDSEVKRLTEEMQSHQKDIEGYKADVEKARTDRDTERKAYQLTHEDYSESVGAISEAIGVLKSQAADKPQVSTLLKKVTASKYTPAQVRSVITGFLTLGSEMRPELALLAAPEANAYEFQSNSIITLLLELKDKFIEERASLEKKEMIAQQAFDTVAMDLRNSISAATNEISKKKQSGAENKQGSTESKALFDEVSAARNDDQKYLTELTTTCQQKSSDFTKRQQLRGDEMEALQKVIEIVSGDQVSGAAEKNLPSMLQHHAGSSLVQFRTVSHGPTQQAAAEFLKDASHRLQSRLLSAISMRVEADPFSNVKKLIQDLITKLKAQESEESDHKTWCDAELKTNGKTRKDKTTHVDGLTSTIEQLESRLSVLEKDLGKLSKQIADILAALSKAGDMRAEEKAGNDETLVDAVGGQTAIAQAKQLLNNFYKTAAAATSFTQSSSKAPPTFDSAYKGQQTEGTGVLAFLDVIASNFARLESETQKAESQAQSVYDTLLEESNESKASKEKEVKDKQKEQLGKKEDLSNTKDDLESAQKQLDAAFEYFDRLKPSCLNVEQPYEGRVQRREEEISSLKEALEILNGQGVPSGPNALYSSVDGGNLAVDNR